MDNVDYTFVPRRRAKIYVDILARLGRKKAGMWAANNVPANERSDMTKYVIQEKEKRGID